jgi:hypothetical protein
MQKSKKLELEFSEICEELQEVPVGSRAPSGTGRRWMFTIQLGRERDLPKDPEALDDLWHINIEQPDIRYVVYQREKSPTTGQLHIQGYIEFTKSIGFRAVQKALDFGKPWVGRARGKQEQCIAYVTKEETRHSEGFWHHGDPEEGGQGARNDLNKIKKLIEQAHESPGTNPEILVGNEDFSTFVKHHKAIRRWFELTARKRNFQPEVIWIYGPSGVGKSRWFWETYPDGYELMVPEKQGEKLWFEDYNGEHAMLIDDFGGEISFKTMLRLLDRNAMKVAVKGTSTQIRSKITVITSDRHPLEIDWGGYVGCKFQLIRRITTIMYIGEKGGEFDVETVSPNKQVTKFLKKVNNVYTYIEDEDSMEEKEEKDISQGEDE